MSTRNKQLVVFWLLMALAVWPLVHHVLVERYEIDKWSFLGFSMYVSKRPIYVYDHENLPQSLHLDWRQVPKEQYPAINTIVTQFVRERKTYGQWYDSGRFARQLFEAVEQIDEFAFDFDVLNMDPKTAVFEGNHYRYAAQRRGPDGKARHTELVRPIEYEGNVKHGSVKNRGKHDDRVEP